MKMNYVSQMVRFMEIFSSSSLSKNEFVLYVVLLNINNGLSRGDNWADSFTLSITQLIEKSKIGNRNAIIRAKNKLVESGLIKYDADGARKGKAGRWSITPLMPANREKVMYTAKESGGENPAYLVSK